MSEDEKSEILRLFRLRARGVLFHQWRKSVSAEIEKLYGSCFDNRMTGNESQYLWNKYKAELQRRGEPLVKPEHYAAVLDRQNLVQVGYLRELWQEELQNPYRAYPIEDLFEGFERIPDYD